MDENETTSFGHTVWAALAGPRAHTTPPWARLTSAWFRSRAVGRQVRLGLLIVCGGSSFYTCSHWAYLQLGLHLSSPPPAPPRHSSLALACLPQGLTGTWHIHAGRGRLTVSSARPPEAQGGGGESGSTGEQEKFLSVALGPTLPAGLTG